MDAFMDKLAQKLNAEEIIQANRSADIDEKLHKKQQEELAVLQVEFDKLQKQILAMQGDLGRLQKSMEALAAGTNDHVHKENVKVYRNVQAVVVDEAAKNAEAISALAQSVEAMKEEASAVKKTPGIFKGILTVGILTMILTAGSAAFLILTFLGVI